MLDREYMRGPIVLRCDGCPSEFIDTGETDLAAALPVARGEGWAVRHEGAGQGWCHFCPDCSQAAVWDD